MYFNNNHGDHNFLYQIKNRKSGPRLLIKKIKLENFKSYLDKHELGPLHQSFSTIVGANGSGKSNIIDAILFIFGKEKKHMRVKKLEELINNRKKTDGTFKFNHSRVDIEFTDVINETSKKKKIIKGTKFIISRIIQRKKKDVLLLNGKKVYLKEIERFFLERNFNLKQDRFLILQGDVDKISLMSNTADSKKNTTGFLEFIEEVIGTNPLKKQIIPLRKSETTICNQAEHSFKKLKIIEKSIKLLATQLKRNLKLYNKDFQKKKIYYR